ncbi:uncharacterized protein C12orf56-like [Sinocyclocheilus grahami]|uniref:uncharacterized protein C12orf56-like n=1 Tax=Sinocyclocheilus grahami TaxID=75366 RepID=UPI0007ACC29B|nr:PREDICTED: uncharacterized protein C12orf56-like [Sinocyclocheilus grahami]
MARTSADGLLRQNNSKLDSFLKRNASQDVYERIRVYEPCVVVSGSVKKVFMHVILSDERVYLSEYQPRALREALSFRHIKSIELINDLPDFLSGQGRERSLHIRIVHTTKNPGKKSSRPKGSGQNKPSFPGRSSSARHSLKSKKIYMFVCYSDGGLEEEEGSVIPERRSASCPNPDDLALAVFNTSPAHSSSSSDQRESPSASVPTALMRRTTTEEKEEELHLYAVSPSSRIYLHLQSSWSSCIIASCTSALGHFLTIGWVFRLLKPHPFLLPFVGYQAQQVVLLLSGPQDPLSPSQAVLLYQRCRVLLACLQHSTCLSEYIRTGFKEEFRYYVKTSGLKDKLPHHYPISQPAQRLLSQLLNLILQKP